MISAWADRQSVTQFAEYGHSAKRIGQIAYACPHK